MLLFFFPMNPSQILIWNVRGLNSVARRNAVRVLVDSAKIDIICLQETKMVAITRQTILSMLGPCSVPFFQIPKFFSGTCMET